MFIGHFPAGYLMLKASPWQLGKAVFAAGLLGSVLPDIDMAYFFLVDDRAHHHHDYLTHRPVLWLTLAGLGTLLFRHRFGRATLALSLGALLHLALDSIAGKIAWAWPVSDLSAPLVSVPATQGHWVMSFLAHWTFKVEIAITLLAALTFWKARKNPA